MQQNEARQVPFALHMHWHTSQDCQVASFGSQDKVIYKAALTATDTMLHVASFAQDLMSILPFKAP